MNNKDKVFIKIKGLYTGTMEEGFQSDGENIDEIETQDDEIEVINVGTYSVVNGKEYIRYEEVYDDSQERSSSIIKIDGDSACLYQSSLQCIPVHSSRLLLITVIILTDEPF